MPDKSHNHGLYYYMATKTTKFYIYIRECIYFFFLKRLIYFKKWIVAVLVARFGCQEGSKMTFEEIGAVAKTAASIPKEWPAEDKLACLCLRGIAERSRERTNSKETLSQEVNEIKTVHAAITLDHNCQRAAWAQYQEFLLRANGLTYEIKKALESRADASALMRLALDLYAALTGNSTMADKLKGMMK